MLGSFCFLLFAVSAGCAPPPSQENKNDPAVRIAIFPFENFSDDKDALPKIIPVIRSRLEKKGIEIIDGDGLDKILLRERIRYRGYIPRGLARKIRAELNVNAILIGAVSSFYAGADPVIGLSARLVDSSSGYILWANQATAAGGDFSKILDLGKITSIDKLIPRVVDRLLADFTTAPPQKETEAPYRIAVMPFQNKSKAREAGIIVTYMTLTELSRNKRFMPVEYGDIRQSIIDARIRRRGEIDYKSMDEMSKSLGVDGFLIGTVEAYPEKYDPLFPPEVAINIRLVDAHKKKILWYDSHQLNGDDNIFILDWGKMRTADQVAYKVISTLIKKMENARWF